MAIARFPSFVFDCPDPLRLATFYGELRGWEVKGDETWAERRARAPRIPAAD
jgi:hypothetical protein